MIARGMIKARTLAREARGQSEHKPGVRLEAKQGSDTAVLYVYEEIGRDYWTGEGVTAKDVVDLISSAKSAGCKALNVRILSGGGDAIEGVGIYEALKRCGLKTTAYLDGLCASAATMVALGCDKVVSAPTSTWMSHRAWTVALGNCDDMRATAEVLEKFDSAIAGAYAEKTGKSAAECMAMMSAETWMTADECKAFGFADEIARGDDDNDAGSEPDGDPDDAQARAMIAAERATKARIEAHAIRQRLEQQANQITRASPGSKASGQTARK